MKQPHGLVLCLFKRLRGGIHHQLRGGRKTDARIAALRDGGRRRGLREHGLTTDEGIGCQQAPLPGGGLSQGSGAPRIGLPGDRPRQFCHRC